MAGFLDRLRYGRTPPSQSASPFAEIGHGGMIVQAGRVQARESDPMLAGSRRWEVARDQMTNASIVAAGLRYFLNMTARPSWRADPAHDKPSGKEAAEFVESVIHGTGESWTRIVRRSAIYRFHGFNLAEWTAKKRDDGRIGLASIKPRPCHTIDEWVMDEHMNPLGVWQKHPQISHNVYLPRNKLVYLLDDTLTDSPEGMGWFRHLVEPNKRLKAYLHQEGLGYQRDMSGIPVGRAPLAALDQAVLNGQLTRANADKAIKAMEDFVSAKSKQADTGMLLDSQPFTTVKPDGSKEVSSALQWGLELLTGTPGTAQELGAAIQRITWDMALIMGVERLLVGREGAGSLSLSQDTSQNLALLINSTLADMAETYDRDIIGPIWAMSGLPDEDRPTLRCEDASFRDAAKVAGVLADMAQAGAMLSPDDPAINDVRDLLGVEHAPDIDPEMAGMVGRVLPITDPDDPEAEQTEEI